MNFVGVFVWKYCRVADICQRYFLLKSLFRNIALGMVSARDGVRWSLCLENIAEGIHICKRKMREAD